MKEKFTIYNASAGSGKTFTLVKEYLAILLLSAKKDTYKNILAITFTNKAVAEMKTRIIDALAAFSKEETPVKYADLLEILVKETQIPAEEIKTKSAAILKSIIHNYAAFEVSTIDGFTHRILRTFAKDLGLPVNFEVELNTDEILTEAVESLINKAGTNKKLTDILIKFTLTKTDDDKSWDISRDLFQIAKLLTNENNQIPLQILKKKSLEDFESFEKDLKTQIKSTKAEITQAATYFFSLIEEHGVEPSNFSGGFVPKHFKKLQDGEGTLNFEAKWALNIENASLYRKTEVESIKTLIDQIQPEIAKIFETTKNAFFQVEFLKEIKKRITQLSLLNEINKEIEAIKLDRNLVLISEFNPRISEEVKNQPVPFIYERLGERYKHYFIDEFQDTSIMQWENLIPLVDHQIASEENSGLTLVGDAKQSIYRWRGGRAEQLIDLSTVKITPFPIIQKITPLPFNYRSGAEIVNFNNRFFQYAAGQLSFPDYADLFKNSEQTPKKGNFGYVNLQFIEAKVRKEEFEIYPEKILELIENLDEKGFSRSDICILTRKKIEGIAIAEYLNTHNIGVVSSETLLVSKAPAVQFIVNLLALSIHPEDKNIKLEIFDFLLTKFKIQDEHAVLIENLFKPNSEIFSWLIDFQINFEMANLHKLSLYEAAEYIIRSFQLAEEADAYLQFFLDFVFETAQKSSGSIIDFLEVWERRKDSLSIVVPETNDAVNIMTVHKAKGLEFPVVIYPFANSDLQDTKKDNLWLEIENDHIPLAYISASKKLLNWGDAVANSYKTLIHQNELDTLNVFYVACTRASQQLYILTNYNETKANNSISTLLSGFLKETGVWNDTLNYSFGNMEKLEISSKVVEKSIEQRKFYSSPIQNQAVHIVTRSGAMWDTHQQEAIEKGEIAHEILSKINTSTDVDGAIENAILDGIVNMEQNVAIKNFLLKIIEHPELKPFFSADANNSNEREILTANGERIRPDRLNFNHQKVTIIDYKTGAVLDKHGRQIKSYAVAMEEMGFRIDKCLLVYINKEVIVKEV